MQLVKPVTGALSVMEAAKQYINRGLAPVPIPNGYKYPNKDDWPSFKCSANDVAKHFYNDGSLGLNLAASSLVDVDFDSPEAVALAHLFTATATISRASKAVSHLLYRAVYDGQLQRKHPITGDILIELRGGNRCVLVPPSIHPNGESLFWKSPDFSQGSVDELKRLVDLVAAFVLVARHWPAKQGSRHMAAMALGGVAARAGVPEDTAVAAMKTITAISNDTEAADRIAALKDSYENHQAAIHVTGLPTLMQHFQEKVAKQIYDWFNVKESDTPKAAASLPDLIDYIMSPAQLMSAQVAEADYIIKPWLATGSLSMTFAERGTGKSFFVLEIGLAVGAGASLFGCWSVPAQRRVLIIDGEMTLTYLKKRMPLLTHDGNKNGWQNIRFLPCDQLLAAGVALNIASPDHQQRIDEALHALEHSKEFRPDLIILDNLSSLAWGVDENSNSELDPVQRWLLSLRSRGYAVHLIHHSTKDGKSQRGASRREDPLDTIIQLVPDRDSQFATFDIRFTKIRGEPPKPRSLRVSLVPMTDGRLKWEISSKQVQTNPIWQTLKAIGEDKPTTMTALSKLIGKSHTAASNHVEKLVEKGLADKKPLRLTKLGLAKFKELCAMDEAAV